MQGAKQISCFLVLLALLGWLIIAPVSPVHVNFSRLNVIIVTFLGHCEASGIFYTDKVLDGWLVNNYFHRHMTFNAAMLIHMYRIKRYNGQLGGIDQLHKLSQEFPDADSQPTSMF